MDLSGGSSGAANDFQAVCTFWDDRLSNFSGRGCAAQPNPLPPRVSAAWAPGLTLRSPAELATAWVLRDNGTAAGILFGCNETLLDCSNATEANRSVYLDRTRPFSAPAVGCGGVVSDRILRVFTGPQCRLWRPDNEERCFWNATKQAFVGAGCLAGNSTKCACTHLTDMFSAKAPKIAVCSAKDLIAINPNGAGSPLRPGAPAAAKLCHY